MSFFQEHNSALLFRCSTEVDDAERLTAFFVDKGVHVGNIVRYVDQGNAIIRVEWGVANNWENREACIASLNDFFVSSDDNTDYQLKFAGDVPSVGLFCSEYTHVLSDTLNRIDADYFPSFTVPFICSDHEAVGHLADRYGIPFFLIPLSASVQEQQRSQLELIERYSPDILALARYDARLSQDVVDQASCTIVSIHNSFLPSVRSEKAYSLAYEQGHKLIGASSRLLLEGGIEPIVTQDVALLGPGDSADCFVRAGQNVERKVFVDALRKLVEHKVMVYNARTMVFD